ncbi:hypothetical protein BKI52_38545 [marine bacterium AO1-C]|nr:hypothetical protein BKI52_38545 [marine bacterium AO1-C]
MRKYPIHIANQLNASREIKTRIQMIYQRASSRANLLKYSFLFMLFVLAYSLFVFRNQVIIWFHQPNPDVVTDMMGIQPHAHDGLWYGDAMYHLTSAEMPLQMKEGAYAGFGFPKMESKTYPRVQLLNEDGMIISTNVKEGQTYFGFRCNIPANGTYTLKVLDYRPGQMVHHITRKENPIEQVAVFSIQQKNGKRQVKLQKGLIYSFNIREYSSQEPGVMTLYLDKKRLANNVNTKGKTENGIMYRCLKSGTYTLDLQSEKGPTSIGVNIWKN